MKKKILFIPYSFSLGGGAEKILSTILSDLSSPSYEIYLKEIVHRLGGNEYLPNNVHVLPPLIDLNRQKFSNKLFILILYLFESIPKYFIKNRSDYDIVISFNYLTPSIYASLFNAKKIAWIHGALDDLDYRKYNNILLRFKYKVYYLSQKKVFNKSDTIIAISNKTKESIIRLYPENIHKIRIIYNGYDFDKIITKSNEILIPKTRLRLIAIGRLDRNKNFSLLVQALHNIITLFDCELLILGEGEERNQLEDLIKKTNLSNRVNLLGYIQNPYPYIKSSDLICLSSFSEGFPTVLVEAMALGVPFVSTKVAGTDELSNDMKCGLVADFNVADFSHKISMLLSNNELRHEMGRNCETYVKMYSIERQMREILNILND